MLGGYWHGGGFGGDYRGICGRDGSWIVWVQRQWLRLGVEHSSQRWLRLCINYVVNFVSVFANHFLLQRKVEYPYIFFLQGRRNCQACLEQLLRFFIFLGRAARGV